MTIYFHNPTEASIEALITLGVNVKLGTNPIGHFGTGFKYAIATLLRTGHSVKINGEAFGLRTASIRGQEFQIITFRRRDLGFTTQLGRNWQVWQAFRELHSNALDEGGGSTPQRPSATTVIAVTGEGIEQAYNERDKIFLESKPLLASSKVEIHKNNKTPHLYYRGVRAGSTELPSIFTYNMLMHSTLTEDRTLQSQFDIAYWSAQLLAQSTDVDMLESVLIPRKGTFEEKRIDFSYCTEVPSPQFMQTVKRLKWNAKCSISAIALYEHHKGEVELDVAVLSKSELDVLHQALTLCSKLGCGIAPSDMIFVDSLGPDVLGLCKKGQIYIAKSSVDMGVRRLASTIYEEWLHKTHGLHDETRSLQNFLLDKLFAVVDGGTTENQDEEELPF